LQNTKRDKTVKFIALLLLVPSLSWAASGPSWTVRIVYPRPVQPKPKTNAKPFYHKPKAQVKTVTHVVPVQHEKSSFISGSPTSPEVDEFKVWKQAVANSEPVKTEKATKLILDILDGRLPPSNRPPNVPDEDEYE
jgi:hypothetical protein